MDDGILRQELTRKAAVEWLKGLSCGDKVLARHQYRPGDYEYRVGSNDQDRLSAWIVRSDQLHHGGWPVDQPALYPHKDSPYDRVEREAESG